MPDHMGQGRELLAVRKLFHITHVHGFPVDGEAVQPHGFHLDPFVPGKRLVCLYDPVEIRLSCRRGASQSIGKLFRLLFRQRRNLHGTVLIHLQDAVRFMEIGTAASRHQHGGNPVIFIQFPHPVDKGDDGFHIPADNPLHQFVPDHEIGGAGVLVDKKSPGPHLHGFHRGRRLGSTAAGVLRIKMPSVLAPRKIADEHGDIHLLDAPAILRPQFHGAVVGEYILPAVSGNMVIDPLFQCFQ